MLKRAIATTAPMHLSVSLLVARSLSRASMAARTACHCTSPWSRASNCPNATTSTSRASMAASTACQSTSSWSRATNAAAPPAPYQSACLVVDLFPAAALPPEPGRENHHLGSSFCSPSPFAGTSLTRNQPVVREHPPLLDFRPLARARRKTTAPAWASSSCPRQRRHLSLEGKITALLPPARARHNRRPSAFCSSAPLSFPHPRGGGVPLLEPAGGGLLSSLFP
jgi:hypothetical protein